jgi:murein DD-endopeptidase MepM/ murein hydrolase activator NlpD
MALFPLRGRPKASYHEAPRAFGSARELGARKHAGCDLYAPARTEVLAVADGRVIRGPYCFYAGVWAIDVEHPGIGVVRYGEISHTPNGVEFSVAVKAGQVIGYVGKMPGLPSMLHFELYAGTGTGPLTDRERAPFMRRADLIDPTEFLDACELEAE